MCLYPKLIKNPKYKPNKKNGGKIPAVRDPRVPYVPIGCGNCIECRKQKARSWQVRLQEDIIHNKNGKFITLTFSNESIKKLCNNEKLMDLQGYTLDNAIATIATRLFLERWRKQYKKSLRHWFVTELGHNGTENIHLHGIVWTDIPLSTLETIWSYGFVWKGKGEKQINYVNARTVNYIVKYITKKDELHTTYKSIILTSPGIGKGYNGFTNTFNGKKTTETYKTSTGHEINLPIYYRNQIYTDEQKEQLWLNKLDKNERWICGEKIKADNTEAYFKTLEWHRKRNAKLGYGDDSKNWEIEEYENARRNLMYLQRLGLTKDGYPKEWDE